MPEPKKRPLWQQLVIIRKEKKMTTHEVAAKIGCSVQAFCFWENGGRDPSLGNAEKWCQALGHELLVTEK